MLKDFVFAVEDQDGDITFWISPKNVWEEEGCISDQPEATDIVRQLGFFESMESAYSFDGSAEDAVKILLKEGADDITKEYLEKFS